MNVRLGFGPNLMRLFILVMLCHFSATYSRGQDKDEEPSFARWFAGRQRSSNSY